MSSERFHKAARDGSLDILKETTRKDCNSRDGGGMTPTLYAAFEGNLDALRLLVARGGDPDKADYFGNTALHLAAARGHNLCVTFLLKFGCNIWALDIDRHSARELAAINGRDKILQQLDAAQADQELNNRKKTRLLREKAERDAEKRLKDYTKRQREAETRIEKEQRKLLKDKAKMDVTNVEPKILPHRTSILTYKGRMKPSPTFSDIVGGGTKKASSAVGRKVTAKKALDDFKVGEVEMDGKRSVRSLTGLQRDSEVMYVGTYETHSQQIGKRGKISDIWGTLGKAKSTPDLLNDTDAYSNDENDYSNHDEPENIVGETVLLQEPASIFNRPGFGSVAFRRSITATLDQMPHIELERQEDGHGHARIMGNGPVNGHASVFNGHNNEAISIGSAGSLARRHSSWEDDLVSDEEDADEEWTPLQRFLVANNLSSLHSILEAEQIDLEALMLLTDADVAALKLPLGPRRKLMSAIENRKRALENPSEIIEDSKL